MRAYQACSRGPVVLSTKYGAPTVTANNATMRSSGCPEPTGFQAALGRIGSASSVTASSAMCTRPCVRGLHRDVNQWAYT